MPRAFTVRILVAFLTLTCLSFGQFKPAKYYEIGGKRVMGFQTIAADFNNDGVLDLAVADSLNNEISILIGKPDGSFQAPIIFSVPFPWAIAAGDVNGDHNQDLIVIEYGGTGNGAVGVFLGDGTGHFKLFGAYLTGIEPERLVVADFNGDGNLDVAVSNHGNNGQFQSMMVFFGDGTGALGQPTSYPFKVKSPGGPGAIAAGDLNGDDHVDLAITVVSFSKKNPTFVAIFLNDGTGRFKLSGKYFAGGGGPSDIAIADLNNDGKPDLAIAADSALGILLNKGGGKFGKTVSYPPCSNCGNLDNLTVADFNLDGNLDVAVTGSVENSVFYGIGKGQFKPAMPIPNIWGQSITSGDFDRNGAPDLAVAIGDNSVAVLLNKK
jgi:VCBS repeat protein